MNAVNSYLETGRRLRPRKQWQRFGLMSFFDQYIHSGQMFTIKNRREFLSQEVASRFSTEELDKIIERSYACPGCHIGDKCFLKLREGKFEGLETTLSAMLMPIFAACSGADGGYTEAVKIHDMCNRNGICELGVCSIIVWLIDLFQNGVITSEDMDGIVPEYNFETLILLLEKTIKREGIGDVIAEGFTGAIERIGRGSEEFSIHIKGFDVEFDPRAAFGSEAFSQCVRPSGGSPPIEAMALTMRDGEVEPRHIRKWVEKRGVMPESAMNRVFVGPPSEFHVGRYTAHMENWYTILDCLGICARPFVGMFCYKPILAELYSAATGIEKTHEDLLSIADRVWNMVKVVNLREGYDRKDDMMPERIFNEPLKFGDKEYALSDYVRSHQITREEWEWLLDGYYDERGWDLKQGWPTDAKLSELGLKDISSDLIKNGYSIKEKTEPISRPNPWE
jgi:aldehyde:ferredoxin oxidoreductase